MKIVIHIHIMVLDTAWLSNLEAD